MTEWRALPFDAFYEVSDDGQVRSRKVWRGQPGPRLLRGHIDSAGYRRVDIGKAEHKVHILVALTFFGPRPDGMDIRHLDGNKLHNSVENLAYGTREENMRDVVRHGAHHVRNRPTCPHNHPYDEANTAYDKRGHRVCRECRRRRNHEAELRNPRRLRRTERQAAA